MPKRNKRNEKNNEKLILLNTQKSLATRQGIDYYNLVISSSEFTNHDTDFTVLSFLSIIALNSSDAAINTKIYL